MIPKVDVAERKNSAQLFELAQQVIPGGVNSFFRKPLTPVVIERAQGAYLWDVEGRQYLDYACVLGASLLGHCHPAVNESVFAALRELDMAGIGNTVYEIELAQKLHQHIPSCEMSLLLVTGSEATYHALRLSRAVTGKTDVIRMDGSYHGWHDYVVAPALGYNTGTFGGVLTDASKHTHTVPMNDLEAVADVVERTGDNVAAVFIEMLMHNAGYIPAQPGYLEQLRGFCTAHGIILVFDEVITGVRHHLGGYQAICGVTPDLTTVGKAMGNGYAVSALCGRRDLMLHFNTAPGGDVSIGGTYNGQASACAAALATINLLEDGNLYKHMYALGDRMRDGINAITNRLGIDAFATGYGSVWVVYFVKPRTVRNYSDVNGADYNVKADLRFRQLLVERGCWVFPVVRKRSYISAAHSEEDIDRTLGIIEDALQQLRREQLV